MTPPPIPWPRIRPLARPRGVARWAWAVVIAAAVNLGIVVGLAHLSQVHARAVPPPLVTRPLTVRPPPPPPSQPSVVPATPVAANLPSLDLPPLTSASPAMTLPMMPPALPGTALPLPSLSLDLDLPVGPVPVVAAPVVPDPDTPATLEGALDLERHYPRSARMRGITGTTVLLLTIDRDGMVQGVDVITSTPVGIFEDAARHLGSGLRFRPAVTAGQPVPSRQRTSIAWTLK